MNRQKAGRGEAGQAPETFVGWRPAQAKAFTPAYNAGLMFAPCRAAFIHPHGKVDRCRGQLKSAKNWHPLEETGGKNDNLRYNEGCPAFQVFLRSLKPFFGLSRFTCVVYTLSPTDLAKARPHFRFLKEFNGATPCSHVAKNTRVLLFGVVRVLFPGWCKRRENNPEYMISNRLN
jgi:hypothetical protein